MILRSELRNQQLTHELALLKRHKYGQRSEHLNVLQISLLDEVVGADIAAIEAELEQLKTTPAPAAKHQPKRAPLPPELPCTEIRHEPDSAHCACGCQLKRIDKGIPTTGLLAQVMIAKYADHLPLYRQEQIFGRAGVPIPRSTLAEWIGTYGVQLQPLVDALRDSLLTETVLHADETPVPMLAPGKKKTQRPISGPMRPHPSPR